jgi:hypothetical protein
MQLDIYENYNRFLRVAHSEGHQQRMNDTRDRIDELREQRTQLLNHTEGESLSIDDLSDIYIQAKAEEREQHNFSLNTRGKTGEISDYLEARRPFGAAQ